MEKIESFVNCLLINALFRLIPIFDTPYSLLLYFLINEPYGLTMRQKNIQTTFFPHSLIGSAKEAAIYSLLFSLFLNVSPAPLQGFDNMIKLSGSYFHRPHTLFSGLFIPAVLPSNTGCIVCLWSDSDYLFCKSFYLLLQSGLLLIYFLAMHCCCL